MAGSAEMLAAFRELTTTKQLDRGDLLELLRDGIHAALARKFGPNSDAICASTAWQITTYSVAWSCRASCRSRLRTYVPIP